MPIKTIDAIAGVDGPRDTRALHANVLGARRASRQESGAVSPGGEAEKLKAAQQQQQQQHQQSPTDQAKELVQASTSLRFKIDQDSGRTVAELLDPEGQVLRQMPTEEALEVAKAIGKFQGAFVNLKV